MNDSDDVFQRIFEDAGVGIFQTSPDGRFLRANQALAEMIGYDSPDDYVASISDIGSQIYVDPTTRPRFLALMERDGQVKNFVVRFRRKDGSEGWASESATPVRDGDGQVRFFIGTSVEITELVRLQQALDEAEGTYRDIFENANLGIYRSSTDGRQLRANPALVRLNGYEKESEQLEAVNDIALEWYVDPGRRAEFKRILDEHDRVEGFESEIFAHKTRRRLWISENAWVVRDSQGRVLYYEGTVQDITERKKAERAFDEARKLAEASSQAKSEFLANMSHELRTPLNAVIGFSDIMLREMFGPIGTERYRGYLRDINDSANLLLRLIEDILDVSKAEAGRLEIEEDVVDVSDIVTDSIRLIALRAEQGRISVVNEARDSVVRLRADARRVRQIVLNLLSNAVKFSREEGSVRVTIEIEDDGAALLTIEDNGVGMEEHEIEGAFEPFVQFGGPGRTREGTGLGLPLTRQLVELHGGSLVLESEP